MICCQFKNPNNRKATVVIKSKFLSPLRKRHVFHISQRGQKERHYPKQKATWHPGLKKKKKLRKKISFLTKISLTPVSSRTPNIQWGFHDKLQFGDNGGGRNEYYLDTICTHAYSNERRMIESHVWLNVCFVYWELTFILDTYAATLNKEKLMMTLF